MRVEVLIIVVGVIVLLSGIGIGVNAHLTIQNDPYQFFRDNPYNLSQSIVAEAARLSNEMHFKETGEYLRTVDVDKEKSTRTVGIVVGGVGLGVLLPGLGIGAWRRGMLR